MVNKDRSNCVAKNGEPWPFELRISLADSAHSSCLFSPLSAWNSRGLCVLQLRCSELAKSSSHLLRKLQRYRQKRDEALLLFDKKDKILQYSLYVTIISTIQDLQGSLID